MFKSEKAMSRLELVITIASIMFILACAIVLSIGEDGLCFLPKGEKDNNTINETSITNEVKETKDSNEINDPNDVIPDEDKIANEIENIIDGTLD